MATKSNSNPTGSQEQLARLKKGLAFAGVWPKAGEVAPPYGLSPEQMRSQMRSMLVYLDNELLLAAFYVLLLLVCFKEKGLNLDLEESGGEVSL
jgi:hypothetical protein